MPALLEEIRTVIADPSVEMIPAKGGRPFGEPSRLDTELFHALEQAQHKMYPSASPFRAC
jgi:hypothetical protein